MDHLSVDPSNLEPGVVLASWWEPVRLTLGQCWHYRVGPLSLYLQRQQDEWLLAWENFPDVAEHYRIISEEADGPGDGLSTSRYVFQRSPTGFRLKPRLLDRPLVVKTNQPVKIPPGENITFYISSPVCVSVELVEPDMALEELTTVRLSDTWFGPSTREGEICYAAKSHARNNKADVPLRPHRAVTPVSLHNQSDGLLAIDKLSIPVPVLAVYGQQDGSLWTDPVSLVHTQGSQMATLRIGKQPAGMQPLSSARVPPQRTSVVRAFINLFGD